MRTEREKPVPCCAAIGTVGCLRPAAMRTEHISRVELRSATDAIHRFRLRDWTYAYFITPGEECAPDGENSSIDAGLARSADRFRHRCGAIPPRPHAHAYGVEACPGRRGNPRGRCPSSAILIRHPLRLILQT